MQNVIKSVILSACLTGAVTSLAHAADVYDLDQGHTEVIFGWSHAGVSMQHGEFEKTVGVVTVDPDDLSKTKVEVTIETASVSTGVEPLDKHLKSADFLQVDSYPEMTFTSTEVKQTGETTLEITGDLSLHGVTKPVTLNAELMHKGEHPLGKILDYYKGDWMGFAATTEIDHMAWGVGSFSTGPITIEINTEMKKR
ncbi:MAG: YceI family protein [Pseudomonadota bacterium]